MMTQTYDCIIVGGGVVGLSVAREMLRRYPSMRLAVLEKEPRLGMHASGRNSGVMHCGIYYGTDTLKARVCATGAQRMIAFAKEEGIAHRVCGKVILATQEQQLPAMETLLKNAATNHIPAERIDASQLREIEPFAVPAVAAIYCPTTAVIDGKAVLARLQQQLSAQGVAFLTDCKVTGIATKQVLTTQGTLGYGLLINCAGAYADTIAKHYGLAEEYALVPFKGIYWKLAPEAAARVRANIYPVPELSLPFLGVHVTRTIDDQVYVGPTAIPALGRENYGILKGIRLGEAGGMARTLAAMYLRNHQNFREVAHLELGKYRKHNFLASAQKLMPSLTADDMLPCDKVGIRPQLFNIRTHRLEMDYILAHTEDSLHVLNAISPAFTSAFAFAEVIVDAVQQRLGGYQ